MSTLVSRNVTLDGHRTSLRLERPIWEAIEEICMREGLNLHQLCVRIDCEREERTLTAGVRVFVLQYFRNAATDEGHAAAGHGAL